VVGIFIIFAIKGEKITIKERVISSNTSSNIGMIIAGYAVIELSLEKCRSSSFYRDVP